MKFKLYFLINLLITVSVSSVAQDYVVKLENDGSKSFHEGKLKIKEGIPFLSLKGDSYEMGLQYGVLMNDLLVSMDQTVDSLIDSYIGGFFLKKWIANIVLNSKIKTVEETMPAEYVEELEGMAKGCDLKLKELKIISYFPQLFFRISCTSFIMKNETDLVHGRNLDWPGMEELVNYPLIVNYYKKDKIPVTVLTFVGYPGAYTGMNHSGLSMSINMNGTPPENNKEVSDYNTGMPLAYKLRNIMENTDNLDGVDKQFKNYSSHAWFITVGSKTDNSGAIYELTRGEVIKNEMNNNFLFVENLSISDKGRYQYSPVWMHGTSNISRERKILELYDRIEDNDLISKSYQILTNTENHHLSHDPSYGYSINNSITIKSCIMDNMSINIYFSYGETLAALNKYLEYNINTGDVTIYQNKKKIPDEEYFIARREYQNWYIKNISAKKKLKDEDYKHIVSKVKGLDLQPAYKALLLSYYYAQLKNDELAFENAEKYISELPDYYHSYYNKYRVMRDKGEYMAAIVALEEMLQTSTITPYYEYLAELNIIKMYDKLLDQNFDQLYLDKINKLAYKIRTDLRDYFIDGKTQKDLDFITSIEEKYK